MLGHFQTRLGLGQKGLDRAHISET